MSTSNFTVTDVSSAIVTMHVKEVRDDSGKLVGAVAPVAVPGLPPVGALVVATTWVGWAHDWEADNPSGAYLPLCVGVNDDPDSLTTEIERRARDAQGVRH